MFGLNIKNLIKRSTNNQGAKQNGKQRGKLAPEIIFENERVIAVNKPADMNVHKDGKTDEWTLSDWMLSHCPNSKNVGEPLEIKNQKTGEVRLVPRHGIVHRLDKETSGVMILAKDQKAFVYLKNQFQKHTIRKTYRAFVYGYLKEDIGMINAPIGRSHNDIRMWNAGRGARGEMREATTRYRTISRFSDIANSEYETQLPPLENRFSYVELYPMTGRTHQLRVHMRFINHPIVSDSLYASNKSKALGFDRVALHAYTLEIDLPDGERTKFEAPLPEDFKNTEKLIGQ